MSWITRQSMVVALSLMLSVAFSVMTATQALSAPDSGKVKLAAIDSITVAGEGNSAELVIKLSSPATYTSYKTTSPLRLVIDISQATQGNISAPLMLNKGNFKLVTVSRFDTDAGVLTRIDVELFKNAEAVISTSPAQPGDLRVAFPSLATADNTAPAADTPATATEPAAPVSPSTIAAEPVPREHAATDKTNTAVDAARTLKDISVKGTNVVLAVDGGVEDFKSFRLNKPERFVVDLFGVKNGLSGKIVPVNAAGVSSARIGLYPEKLRVVFDAINGRFPEATATKSAEGVTVALASNVQENPNTRLAATRTDREATAASEPKTATETGAAESAPEKSVAKSPSKGTGPASVEMLDFQVVDGISRVAVKVRGESVAEQPVKSPGFVTVTLKNTSLPKHLQRSLDSKAFVSPVLRVTPIQVKTKKGADTKLRFAMRVPAVAELRQEADMIYVEFKNPEGMTADKLGLDTQDQRPQSGRAAKASPAKDELSTELGPATDMPAKTSDVAARSYKGRKVTLEFADAEVRKIFQLLSEVSNKNFVLGDDVTGTISIKLVNVPWDQALDIILDTKGLEKREDGNIVIIKGKGKFKSQSEEEQEIKKALIKAIELKTETFSINYAELGSIVAQLNTLKTDRGAIASDARTNKLIVKDIPQAIEDMRKLIQQLDVPEKQVMIEARIVEATSTFTRTLGVNWGVHYRDGSASFLGINSLDTAFGGLTSAPPTSGAGPNTGGSMGISFGTLTSNIQLDMRLNAAASAGLVKIVSTPKVATLNNKTAKITQGQQIPYTSSTSDKVETKFIEAALSLEVTPHINANGTIGMKIDAKNDSPGQSTGGSAPPINKKQATTEMLLKDGETTVIGGIYVDSDQDSDDGVPFLMDIPFLGKLFKTNQKTKTKTELLIFITPRILGTI